MLRVLHRGRNVGHLWAEAGVLRFRYSREWRSAPDAAPLAPLLPLDGEAHSGDAVRAFFGRLLPGDGECTPRSVGPAIPEEDLHARLERVAFDDLPGAFSLSTGAVAGTAEAYHPCGSAGLRSNLVAFATSMAPEGGGAGPAPPRAARLRVDVCAMQGDLWRPSGGAASTHTVKSRILPEHAFPDVLENEALCLGTAALAGLPVVAARLLRVPDPVLLLERCDRIVEGGEVCRLHRLDFCQLAGLPPGRIREQDGGLSLAGAFGLIDRHAAVPARARVRTLDWVLFNFLIGNGGAHAGHLALLAGPDGRFALAPADALACTAAQDDAQTPLAMSIGGEYAPDRIGAGHWEALAEAVGANPSLLRRRAQALAHRLPDALWRSADALGLARDAPVVKVVWATIRRRAGSFTA